jgi:hypothetical protein|tara:strand:+ start:601 stop:804 length:204 start_codon:yes stop_codon:yes gene_type:complete
MFSMTAMSVAMPTVGVRRAAVSGRVAQAPAAAFPTMTGMSGASLGLRVEGARFIPNRFVRAPEPRRV